MSKPRILSTSTKAESRLFRIDDINLEFSNGVRATYESIRMGDAGIVVVAAVNARQELVMVREFAACADRYELGFVKGKIDPDESPKICAGRELKEEIGFGARHIEYLRAVTYSPAYTNLLAHLFIATDLYEESAEGDEPEPLEQICWPIDKIDALYNHSELTDVRVLLMLNMIQTRFG